jgi:hypothetical protein
MSFAVERPLAASPETAAPPPNRNPLGMPAGSVRAIITFMVLGLVWALLLLPEDRENVHIPIYLYYLMFLILGHYFAARSHAPAPAGVKVRHPLWLPRGSIRFLILAGFAAVGGWVYYVSLTDPYILDRVTPDTKDIIDQRFLPVVMVGAFLAGIVVSKVANFLLAGPQGLPAWFQDIQAWVSLLAIFGLGIEVLLQLVINQSVPEGFNLPHWQAILTGIIAFYFGARS